MKNKITILIPARMESTRFPGKPLAPINGIPMIVFCARNALETGLEVYVCTDSKEVESVCTLYNVSSLLTPEFNTGTDRIAHAAKDLDTDYVINLQGDEPLINPQSINLLINNLEKMKPDSKEIITGVSYVNSEQAFDPNIVKCALIKKDLSIQYFSRKPLLNFPNGEETNSYIKQLGLYGMTKETLKEFSLLEQGDLEKAEKVELLRWLENGNKVKGCIIDQKTISVDTPQDLVDALDVIYSK